MKIQYASDLHLEFAENWRYLREHPLEKAGDILVLAGDIGYIGDENYSLHPFWNQVADQYEQVLVIPGNHEFYKYYDIASLQEGELVRIRSNVKVYYNAIVNLGEVDMILSTLWAHIPLQDAFATESGVTDFHRIMFEGETLTFEQFNKEHERCMDYLRRACESSSASKRVIVTHHVPSFQLSSPDFKGSRINGAFVSNEDDFIETCGAEYWIYGHSHRNIDKLIGKTQCVSNQLGYVFAREHQSFDSGKIIDI